MNKLSFSQKNDLVVKHKEKKHFGKDLELFQKYFPSHRLMNDLARANAFSFEGLDGQMLYLLLDKVSMEDILKNREKKSVVSIEPQPTLEAMAKEKLEELSKRIDALQDDIETNESDISDLRSELEDKDTSIETLEGKIAELETQSAVKKKAKERSSQT